MTDSAATAMDSPRMSTTQLWFSFEGRISRSTYWLKYFLPWFGIYLLAGIVDAVTGVPILLPTMSLVGIWVGLAVGAKRCHDRDRSGWFQLIMLIPIVGGIWLLIELGFLRGTIGENRFGPDPVVA